MKLNKKKVFVSALAVSLIGHADELFHGHYRSEGHSDRGVRKDVDKRTSKEG